VLSRSLLSSNPRRCPLFIPMLYVEDRSFYADELEKLTGKPRRYWGRLPLFLLQKRLAQEMRRWILEMESRPHPIVHAPQRRESEQEIFAAQAG